MANAINWLEFAQESGRSLEPGTFQELTDQLQPGEALFGIYRENNTTNRRLSIFTASSPNFAGAIAEFFASEEANVQAGTHIRDGFFAIEPDAVETAARNVRIRNGIEAAGGEVNSETLSQIAEKIQGEETFIPNTSPHDPGVVVDVAPVGESDFTNTSAAVSAFSAGVDLSDGSDFTVTTIVTPEPEAEPDTEPDEPEVPAAPAPEVTAKSTRKTPNKKKSTS